MKAIILFFLLMSHELYSFNPIRSLFDSVLNYKAHKQYQQGDFSKAEYEYQQLLADDPGNPEYEYNVGVSLYKQKKYEQAQAQFLKTVEHAHDHASLQERALFNRGNCFFEQNQWQNAIDEYKKVLQINANNQNAQHNLQLAEQKLQEQKRKEQEQKKKEEEQKKQQQQDQKQDKQND
nr:tetratricopeptide repeat protein [Candidatus Babeliales bacterium]